MWTLRKKKKKKGKLQKKNRQGKEDTKENRGVENKEIKFEQKCQILQKHLEEL